MLKGGKIDKVYYSIGEVAELFEVNPSLIRFWEREFDILRPSKNKKGNRLYTKQDLDTLRVIYHLVRERGYTLQGAREKLKTGRDEVTRNVEVIDSLQKIRDYLLKIREEIDHEKKS